MGRIRYPAEWRPPPYRDEPQMGGRKFGSVVSDFVRIMLDPRFGLNYFEVHIARPFGHIYFQQMGAAMRFRRFFGVAILALLVAAVCPSAVCHANTYTFTYSDSGDAAHGILNTGPSGLNDGSVLVTSGYIDVTESSNANLPTGTYAIAAGGPAIVNGPNFFYDQLLYPADNAGSGANNTGCCNGAIIANPSYLDNYGLTFGDQVTAGPAISIWGNGGNDYAFYGWTAAGGYNPQVNGGGTFAIQLVPEPSSIVALCGLGAMGLIFSVRRRRTR